MILDGISKNPRLKIAALSLAAFGIIALLLTSAILLLETKALNVQLSQSKRLAQEMQANISSLNAEKDNLVKDKAKIQFEVSSSAAVNTRLQQEKGTLQKDIEDAKNVIRAKDEELKKAKQALTKMERRISEEVSMQEGKYTLEKESLKGRIGELENSVKGQKAVYYYNLGVSYTQAKFYDEAAEAYEQSLALKEDNPEAHYNLALLYDSVKGQPDKAAYHYNRYLELKPEAVDKEEVKAALERLR